MSEQACTNPEHDHIIATGRWCRGSWKPGKRGPTTNHTLTILKVGRSHQAVCGCGEAGYLRDTEDEAREDHVYHSRSGRWPTPEHKGPGSRW